MSESQSVSRSRLELAREEVDRVFGPGHAAEHPELVVAIVHAASSDWAARVICAALEDTPRRNAGRSRSLAPVMSRTSQPPRQAGDGCVSWSCVLGYSTPRQRRAE
jgi:hypothetical protein